MSDPVHPGSQLYCPWCDGGFNGTANPVCPDCGHPVALRSQVGVQWVETYKPSDMLDEVQKKIIHRVESDHLDVFLEQMEENTASEEELEAAVSRQLGEVSDQFDRWIELADEGRYAPHRREQHDDDS